MKRYYFSLSLAFLVGISSIVSSGGDHRETVLTLKPLNSGAAYSRLCAERDLRGLWSVVKWSPYMRVKGADWRESLFLRHQWFEFDGDGHLKTVASNKKMNRDTVVKLLGKTPWGVDISFKRDGFCEISSESKKYPGSVWRCALITRDIKIQSRKLDLRKGDVIMTLLGDDENILYFRQMRKRPLVKSNAK
ncbi:MAG: hypothetical protein GXP32_07250 [Kiritimatiellaeota bacterium]|nr:hypothetical protein [Kiritimatiellota bacterium]